MGRKTEDRDEGPLGFFTVIGWTATVVGLVNAELLSVRFATYALVGMVMIVALSAALRSFLVRTTLRVALPLAAIAFLVIREGHGDTKSMTALLGALIALLLVLFGLYVMIRGFFR